MTERERLEQAIAALEAQREILGDEVADAALGPMRRRLTELAQAAGQSTAGAPRKPSPWAVSWFRKTCRERLF